MAFNTGLLFYNVPFSHMTVFEFSGQPRPQTQPPGPGGMPSGGAGGGGQSGDLQAQWAEYYRQLGYFYGQQPQGGGGGNQPTGPPGEQKVGVESLEKHGTIVQEIINIHGNYLCYTCLKIIKN